ncbi:hypothetical protein FQZ97_985880 [compost metagenome]
MHRALGFAGGARGVDQDREVAGPAAGHALFQQAGVGAGVFAAQGAQGVEADHLRVVQIAQAFHVEHHDLLQSGQPLAHLQGLVELFVVFHEQHRGARVFAEELHLLSRVGGVDAIGHTARAQHGQIGQHPFHGGVGEHGCRLVRRKAQRHQPVGDLAHRFGGLVPGPAAPDAELLLPHPHVGTAPLHRVPEHRGNGVTGQHNLGLRLDVRQIPEVTHVNFSPARSAQTQNAAEPALPGRTALPP